MVRTYMLVPVGLFIDYLLQFSVHSNDPLTYVIVLRRLQQCKQGSGCQNEKRSMDPFASEGKLRDWITHRWLLYTVTSEHDTAPQKIL